MLLHFPSCVKTLPHLFIMFTMFIKCLAFLSWRVNLFSNQSYYTPYHFGYLCLHVPKHFSYCHTLSGIALRAFRALPDGPSYMFSSRHISVSPSMFLKLSFHIHSHMCGSWFCSIPITIPLSFISGSSSVFVH